MAASAMRLYHCVRETFEPATSHGGHDGADGRALRYLQWTQDPDPDDTVYRVDFACLLREADGSLRAESDHQRFGLFARAEWLRLIEAAGVAASCARDDWGRDVFFGARAGQTADLQAIDVPTLILHGDDD
jgi:pimeloyl-ACP methyl ester carboxylesterase